MSTAERCNAIMKAHVAALGDRDHRDVSAADLFPEIAKLVAGVTHEEIVTALLWKADEAKKLAKAILPKLTEEHARARIRAIISAHDHQALAVAFEQGHQAGSEGKIKWNDDPSIYRNAERAVEAAAWFHGYLNGEHLGKFANQVTDAWFRRDMRSGRSVVVERYPNGKPKTLKSTEYMTSDEVAGHVARLRSEGNHKRAEAVERYAANLRG